MARIKSFSTNNGDMFYIRHGSDNFTIIDCCIDEDNKERIIKEINSQINDNDIVRFISTHPDDDHIRGIKLLYKKVSIPNFYCVKNEATKPDKTDDFDKYCDLRDNSKNVCYLKKNIERHWLNLSDSNRKCAGIHVLWPNPVNEDFKNELALAKEGTSFNNLSPILTYKLQDSISIYWFGDMENDFIEKIKDKIEWVHADVIFAPHHGRKSGTIPHDVLEKINPKIIIIGDGPNEYLNYYEGYNTITQNTAEDILINCVGNTADFYVSNFGYNTAPKNLKNISDKEIDDYMYIGSLIY